MLLSFLVGYFAVVVGTFWLAVRAFRQSPALAVLPRLSMYVVVLAETTYMLRSPACVYVPRAAADAPAIERVLVGKDASGRLWRLEGRSPVAFAFGPRWWFRVGHTIEGGLEFVPPIRYAVRDATTWEVVSSDGYRRPFPTDGKVYGPRGPPRPDAGLLVRSDGALLSWLGRCMYVSSPADPTWRCLGPIGPTYDVEATALLEEDHTLEVRVEEIAFRASQGRIRNLTFIQRDPAGRQILSQALMLPALPAGETASQGSHHLRATPTGDGLVLVEASYGKGHVYWISRDFHNVEVRANFAFEWLGSGPPSLATSDDGQLFTTGHTVFRTTGERVRELDSPLASCVWVGHTLHGVQRYPFFAFDALNRAHAFQESMRAGRMPVDPLIADVSQRSEKYRQALARSAWVLGGIDEAGRADRLVEVAFP